MVSKVSEAQVGLCVWETLEGQPERSARLPDHNPTVLVGTAARGSAGGPLTDDHPFALCGIGGIRGVVDVGGTVGRRAVAEAWREFGKTSSQDIVIIHYSGLQKRRLPACHREPLILASRHHVRVGEAKRQSIAGRIDLIARLVVRDLLNQHGCVIVVIRHREAVIARRKVVATGSDSLKKRPAAKALIGEVYRGPRQAELGVKAVDPAVIDVVVKAVGARPKKDAAVAQARCVHVGIGPPRRGIIDLSEDVRRRGEGRRPVRVTQRVRVDRIAPLPIVHEVGDGNGRRNQERGDYREGHVAPWDNARREEGE